jgi:hypothetical protein
MGALRKRFKTGHAPVVISALTARGFKAVYPALVNLRAKGISPDGYTICAGGGVYQNGEFVGKSTRKDNIIRIMQVLHPTHSFHMYDDSRPTYEAVAEVAVSSLVPRPEGAPQAIGEGQEPPSPSNA